VEAIKPLPQAVAQNKNRMRNERRRKQKACKQNLTVPPKHNHAFPEDDEIIEITEKTQQSGYREFEEKASQHDILLQEQQTGDRSSPVFAYESPTSSPQHFDQTFSSEVRRFDLSPPPPPPPPPPQQQQGQGQGQGPEEQAYHKYVKTPRGARGIYRGHDTIHDISQY
jgi:hypothetical protein